MYRPFFKQKKLNEVSMITNDMRNVLKQPLTKKWYKHFKKDLEKYYKDNPKDFIRSLDIEIKANENALRSGFNNNISDQKDLMASINAAKYLKIELE